MKIARARLADARHVLVRIEGDSAIELTGRGEHELPEVCMDIAGDSWAEGPSHPLDTVSFLPPVAVPPSVRDFMAFEAHVRNVVEGSGGTMNKEWGDVPVFYFSNPQAIVGDNESVVIPPGCRSLDYELEIACVIGATASDIDPASPDALSCVAGFTLLNDWSARDFAAKEMKQGLGPAKGKDFATSVGPWVVTPDEIPYAGGVVDVPLTLRVNDAVRSEGSTADMHFSWPQLLARASAGTRLVPGDIIGSGTVGSGCLLELRLTHGRDENPWLSEGDVVELESPLLGRLRNEVARR